MTKEEINKLQQVGFYPRDKSMLNLTFSTIRSGPPTKLKAYAIILTIHKVCHCDQEINKLRQVEFIHSTNNTTWLKPYHCPP